LAVAAFINVLEKIDFLVRFWELRARSESQGVPLGAAEQVELLSLMQLVTSAKVPATGPVARDRGAIPAQLVGEGDIQAIEVRSVTAEAILVAAPTMMSAGARVILRIADAVSGIELALPCTVVWAYRASPCTMALEVDGIPTRTDFVAPVAAPPVIRFGAKVREPAVS
jgi:hypothetical protein